MIFTVNDPLQTGHGAITSFPLLISALVLWSVMNASVANGHLSRFGAI